MVLLKLNLFIILSVILHEIGHFIAARSLGFKVDEFSIGFGPTLKKFKKGNTEFTFNAIPLNGHIYIDIDIPNLTKADKLKIIPVVFAGPAINIVMAAALFFYSPYFALISFLFGVSNLIPLSGSDGQQILAYLYSILKHRGE